MHKLFCVIGDDDNPDYEKVIEVEVKGTEAYAITHTWEDNNEEIYNRFCDRRLTSEYDLPYRWYFIKLEDRGEC